MSTSNEPLMQNQSNVDFAAFGDVPANKKARSRHSSAGSAGSGGVPRSRAASVEYLGETIADAIGDESEGGISNNLRTLIVTFILFTTITVAQTVGALIANSLALLADCGSMAIDAASYLGNIIAETRQGSPENKIKNRLIASGASFLVLLAVSFSVIVVAIQTLMSSGDDDDVNAWIVFAFAVAGLLFDLLSFLAYFVGQNQDAANDQLEASEDARQNMISALFHIGSDTLRSTTTLMISILIFNGFNGGDVDAVASIIVSAMIVAGALHALWRWSKEVIAYRNGSLEELKNPV